MKKNEKAIKALEDMKRQIEEEQWTIFANDRGSGSAGVRQVDNVDVIDDYLKFAKTGENSELPQCESISYTSVDDFDDEDNEICGEIVEQYSEYVERDEVLGLVVINEHYDMDYTFYLLHIKG